MAAGRSVAESLAAMAASLPGPVAAVAEELFRRRVVRMLVRRGRLEEDAAQGRLSWRHSGFSVHHAVRAKACDRAGVERLCRYPVHPPIALGRLHYDGTRGSYRGRRAHPVGGAASVTLDPVERLARLCQHLPPRGLHPTRLYGAHADRTRGARARPSAAGQGRGQPRAMLRTGPPRRPARSRRRRASAAGSGRG